MTTHRALAFSLSAALLVGSLVSAPAAGADVVACIKGSGKTAEKCLKKGLKAAEERVSPPSGLVRESTDKTRKQIVKACESEEDAITLGYTNFEDVITRVNDNCELFTYEMNGLVYDEAQTSLDEAQLSCRRDLFKTLAKVSKKVLGAWGKKCSLVDYTSTCDRAKRDASVAKARASGEKKLLKKCGADFDAVVTTEGDTLEERIAAFVETAVVRGRHYSERVYPPNNYGPTAAFGPFRIGVTTLFLEDGSRMNVAGTGPRPVTVEIYYPTTDAAIEGLPQDVAQVFGIDVAEVPAYRDAELTGSALPLVLFSHGNVGTRIQSFFFAGHLASHGYIVASMDHHGNTIDDTFSGTVDEDVATNRPLDVSFTIDELLSLNATSEHVLEGAIDPAKIGMSGHSFGGYTTFAVAGGPFALGTFTDTRIGAIFPQAPAASFFEAEFFATIAIPTLIVGGTIDETTPFDSDQQFPFDNLPSGADVVGLAEIVGAGHFTFSSFCEIREDLLAALGGFEEACEARHQPWRHAQDATNYLALNFFDATLSGDAAALARLDAGVLAGFDAEDILYQNK